MARPSAEPPSAGGPPRLAYLGRQPILDVRLRTVGYELLYRSGEVGRAIFDDGVKATSTVLANTLVEFGVDRVVGRAAAWVNFPAAYLLDRLPIPLSPSHLVVEVLEDVEPTQPLIDRLREMRKQGYRIALDDCVFRPELQPLVDLANTVKIDVSNLSKVEIQRQMAPFAGGGLELLAEKVETMQDFQICAELGFTRFQGYFMCKPELMRQRRPPTNRIALLRLLSELHSEVPDLRKIEHWVSQDVGLSYQLLKCLNSSAYALPCPVDSIHHALVMLGLQRLRNLVALIVLGRVDDKPSELLTTALMRARIGEQLARFMGVSPESMFTVGLFSVLDALVGMPMEQLLEKVPLSAELGRAIKDREGPCGRLLSAIEAHEHGEWDRVVAAGVDLAVLTPAWVDAAVWVNSVRGLLNEGPSSHAASGSVGVAQGQSP